VNPIWPSLRARFAASVLALACAIPLLFADGAASTPGGDCREKLCVGSVQVGTVPVTWTSPELFYPNNEDLFAAVYVGTRELAEVRAYGPALCRHRFNGARIGVVVKACTPETALRVRAISRRKNTKLIRVIYAARPDIGGDMQQAATAATIYDDLTQITGLGVSSSSGL
jgi:hypothetical protein